MNRTDFELLGDKHKQYELRYETTCLPGCPVVIRLDGRAFHTFTKGLKRPYDIRMSEAMIETTKHLVNATNANVGFCQSDEISIGFKNDLETGLMFRGRVQKICSIVASVASVYFNRVIGQTIPEKVDMFPVFDARVIQYPTLELATESFLWRETDATRNSLSMMAQSYFSPKELHGKGTRAKHDMLYSVGQNWNDAPTFFKRGTYVACRKMEKFLTLDELVKIPEIHRPTGKVVRNVCVDLSLNPCTTIENFVGVLFNKEDPINKQ